MALMVCAATPRELAALAPDIFPKAEAIPEMQPMKGTLKNGEALFMATGIGPLNTSLAMGFCFGLTHPDSGASITIDAVLYAGLAGSFDLAAAPLCSIWQITTEIWPEYGLNDGTSVTAAAFSYPQWHGQNREPVYDRLNLAPLTALVHAKKKGEPWPTCASLTVAGVTASFARRNALWDAWHAELENMEGFAAAYAALRADVPLVEIRSVSNKVGPRGKNEKDFDGALSALSDILPELGLI